MSKLVNGYLAIFREATINGEIRGDKLEAEIGSRGELTVWESEKLHPGEKYIRFKTDENDVVLQTSCGAITIKKDLFTIYTQNGENKYSFELIKKIQTIDFLLKPPEKYWHICCGCGKREILSSKEAFDKGWDYPGSDGIYASMPNYGFGILSPRTCGECTINQSLYWRIMTGEEISEKDKEILVQIQNEPLSLLIKG